LEGHDDDVLSVDFCEPNILATSSYDIILVWNIDSGFPRHTLSLNTADNKSHLAELSAVEKVLFLPKKRTASSPHVPLLSCGNDGYIRIWDTEEGKHVCKVHAVPHAPGESVVTMSANRENTVLVSGDSKGFVRVWDISHLTLDRHSIHHHHQLDCTSHWRAHSLGLVSVDYVEGRNTILTSSTDCTIRLWTNDGTYVGTFGQNAAWNLDDPLTFCKKLPPGIVVDMEDRVIQDDLTTEEIEDESSTNLLLEIISSSKERNKKQATAPSFSRSTPSRAQTFVTSPSLYHQQPTPTVPRLNLLTTSSPLQNLALRSHANRLTNSARVSGRTTPSSLTSLSLTGSTRSSPLTTTSSGIRQNGTGSRSRPMSAVSGRSPYKQF